APLEPDPAGCVRRRTAAVRGSAQSSALILFKRLRFSARKGGAFLWSAFVNFGRCLLPGRLRWRMVPSAQGNGRHGQEDFPVLPLWLVERDWGGGAYRETSPHQSPAATASPQGEAVGGNRKPFRH